MAKLLIPTHCMQQLSVYVQTADGEVSGLFTVEPCGKDMLMKEVFIYEQESSAAATELSPEDQITAIEELIIAGREDVIEDLKGWWHSHANMAVCWSGVDTKTQEEEYAEMPYLVSLVMNKKGEMKARLNIYTPIPLFLDLDAQVAWYEHPDKDAWIEEVKEKVKKPRPKGVVGYQGGVNGNPYNGQGRDPYSYMGYGGHDWRTPVKQGENKPVDTEEVRKTYMPDTWHDCPGWLTNSCTTRGCLKRFDRKCTRYGEQGKEEEGTPLGKRVKPEDLPGKPVVATDVPIEDMVDADVKKFLEDAEKVGFKEIQEMHKEWLGNAEPQKELEGITE